MNDFKGITHMLMGLCAFMILKGQYYIGDDGGGILACIILGSLLPDIDHPRSKLGKYAYPISAVVRHRGFTHSLIASFILPLPIILIDQQYYQWILIGFLLHLLADTLTPGGVMWLYPCRKRYSLKIAKTGGLIESVLFIFGLFIIFLYIIKN